MLKTAWCTKAALDPRARLVILLTITRPEHLPLAEVKSHLSEVVEQLERHHGRVVITKHGRPTVVMMTLDDLESLEETLEILSHAELLEEILEAEADIAHDRTSPLTKDEATELIKDR